MTTRIESLPRAPGHRIVAGQAGFRPGPVLDPRGGMSAQSLLVAHQTSVVRTLGMAGQAMPFLPQSIVRAWSCFLVASLAGVGGVALSAGSGIRGSQTVSRSPLRVVGAGPCFPVARLAGVGGVALSAGSGIRCCRTVSRSPLRVVGAGPHLLVAACTEIGLVAHLTSGVGPASFRAVDVRKPPAAVGGWFFNPVALLATVIAVAYLAGSAILRAKGPMAFLPVLPVAPGRRVAVQVFVACGTGSVCLMGFVSDAQQSSVRQGILSALRVIRNILVAFGARLACIFRVDEDALPGRSAKDFLFSFADLLQVLHIVACPACLFGNLPCFDQFSVA